MTTQTIDQIIDALSECAAATDLEPGDLREFLSNFTAAGGINFGLNDSNGPIASQSKIIRAVAENCVSSAFVIWSHRMTVEYLDRWATESVKSKYFSELLSGARIGSTALATALADKSGKELLPITFTETEDSFVIDGVIPWASNLYPDTLVVFAARNPETEERIVVAAELGFDGIELKPAGQLLGLNATSSGTVKFNGLRLAKDFLLTRNVDLFLGQMRPRFLVLQTSFCLGITRAALDSIATAPSAGPFSADITQFQQHYDTLAAELDALNETLEVFPAPGNGHAPLPYLKLRLAAAELAQAVTRVELATIGGRGYYTASPTSRRIRESLFLSVQAPTEGSLRSEISLLS
jgi:alkylation response protein AidB-like acyl-CoA dehydrogenase